MSCSAMWVTRCKVYTKFSRLNLAGCVIMFLYVNLHFLPACGTAGPSPPSRRCVSKHHSMLVITWPAKMVAENVIYEGKQNNTGKKKTKRDIPSLAILCTYITRHYILVCSVDVRCSLYWGATEDVELDGMWR